MTPDELVAAAAELVPPWCLLVGADKARLRSEVKKRCRNSGKWGPGKPGLIGREKGVEVSELAVGEVLALVTWSELANYFVDRWSDELDRLLWCLRVLRCAKWRFDPYLGELRYEVHARHGESEWLREFYQSLLELQLAVLDEIGELVGATPPAQLELAV